MTSSQVGWSLDELEQLPATERYRRVSKAGRDADNHRLLRGWYENGAAPFYQRQLVLVAARAAPAGSPLVEAAFLRQIAERDPHRRLRAHAVKLLARALSGQQQHDGVAELFGRTKLASEQLAIFRAVRRHPATVDRLLASLDARQLARLLPHCSPALFEQHRQRLFADASSTASGLVTKTNVRPMARRHPVLLATAMLDAARRSSGQHASKLWQQFCSVVDLLGVGAPDQTVQLLEAMLPHWQSVPDTALPRQLVRRRSNDVARLLLGLVTPPRRAPFDRQSYRRLDEALFRQLCERRVVTAISADMLPAQRRLAFELLGASLRHRTTGLIDAATVRLLPVDLREAEARRQLALPAAADSVHASHSAAVLPWSQARDRLAVFLADASADVRAAAIETLLHVAVYRTADSLDAALAFVLERSREQDPVRQRVMAALAQIPPSRWLPRHLDGLAQVFQHALDAADCSDDTLLSGVRLVAALAPWQADFAGRWFARFWRALQYEYVWLDARSQYHVRRYAPTLCTDELVVFEPAEVDDHRLSLFFALLRIVDRAVSTVPALSAQLERLARHPSASVAQRAVEQLIKFKCAGCATLLPALLGDDASLWLCPAVQRWCHVHRQDLLTAALHLDKLSGKFAALPARRARAGQPTPDDWWPTLCDAGLDRWTHRQQLLYGRRLAAKLNAACQGDTASGSDNDRRSARTSAHAVRQFVEPLSKLASLPDDEQPLYELASASNDNVAVRDVCISALSAVQSARAMAELQACMSDSRAAVAVAALSRQLRSAAPATAVDVLRAVPLKKVAVAKEVVRMLGEQGAAGLSQLLALEQTKLHTDVRAALLTALLRRHVCHADAFAVLASSAGSTNKRLGLALVAGMALDDCTDQESQQLLLLVEALLAHPDVNVRRAVLTLCASPLLVDSGERLAAKLGALIASPTAHESTQAAQVYFGKYASFNPAAAARLVAGLLPNRRALHSCIAGLLALPLNSALATAAARIIDALAGDAATAVFQTRIAARTLDVSLLVATLQRLHASAALTCDAVQAFVDECSTLATAFLKAAQAALAAAEEPRLRRLSFAAFEAATAKLGWTDQAEAELLAYRQDPSLEVSAAALFLFPPVAAPAASQTDDNDDDEDE